MEELLRFFIPVFLILAFFRLCLAPVTLAWKLSVNAGSGFICMWLLNLMSGFTGLLFPINLITALIAGFLGLPGIALLAGMQLFL